MTKGTEESEREEAPIKREDGATNVKKKEYGYRSEGVLPTA